MAVKTAYYFGRAAGSSDGSAQRRVNPTVVVSAESLAATDLSRIHFRRPYRPAASGASLGAIPAVQPYASSAGRASHEMDIETSIGHRRRRMGEPTRQPRRFLQTAHSSKRAAASLAERCVWRSNRSGFRDVSTLPPLVMSEHIVSMLDSIALQAKRNAARLPGCPCSHRAAAHRQCDGDGGAVMQ